MQPPFSPTIAHKLPRCHCEPGAHTGCGQDRQNNEPANVGRGHVPAGVGTTKYGQTCSFQLSAASRSAGTCPRPTVAVSFIVVHFSHVDCEAQRAVAISSSPLSPCHFSLSGTKHTAERKLPSAVCTHFQFPAPCARSKISATMRLCFAMRAKKASSRASIASRNRISS